VSGPEPSLPEKIVAIHQRLDEARIRHAFGGALALAYYAEPRATVDIDLNVFAPTKRWTEIGEALAPLGVKAEDLDRFALERDGQCRLWWGRTPLDLFFSYDPFHEEMRKGARKVPFGEVTLPVLAPEHLTVCKAMFDRPKDWLDIEQILIGTEGLDVGEIDEWLTRMVGTDDPRTRHFEELKASLSS
jgi:hypothetical protein